jgi:hypothetical protein
MWGRLIKVYTILCVIDYFGSPIETLRQDKFKLFLAQKTIGRAEGVRKKVLRKNEKRKKLFSKK